MDKQISEVGITIVTLELDSYGFCDLGFGWAISLDDL